MYSWTEACSRSSSSSYDAFSPTTRRRWCTAAIEARYVVVGSTHATRHGASFRQCSRQQPQTPQSEPFLLPPCRASVQPHFSLTSCSPCPPELAATTAGPNERRTPATSTSASRRGATWGLPVWEAYATTDTAIAAVAVFDAAALPLVGPDITWLGFCCHDRCLCSRKTRALYKTRQGQTFLRTPPRAGR